MNYSKYLLQGYVSPNDDDALGDTDSESIQNAIRIACECGIGKVIIPKYNKRANCLFWTISKTVLLSSNLTIVLDNCYLQMQDGVYENVFRTENTFSDTNNLLNKGLENIYIIGEGHAVLDGGKPNGLCEFNQLKNGRPHVSVNSAIMLYNVRNFAIKNISILNQRYWGIRIGYCSFGVIKDLYICAIRDRNNQDGIDLRNGCNNILIEGITAQTGDDAIALSGIDTKRNDKYNLVIEKMDDDIHDITIRDVCGAALIHPLIAIRNHDGIKVYNILIENIKDTPALKQEEVQVCVQKERDVISTYIQDVGETDHIEMCDYSKLPRYGMIHVGDKAYYDCRHSVMGETSNITIRDINCSYSERAIVFGCELKNMFLKNISASGKCQSVISNCPRGTNGGPSVKIENLLIDGIWYKSEVKDVESAVVNFGEMPEDDYIKNMRITNAYIEDASHLVIASSNVEISLENTSIKNLRAEPIQVLSENKNNINVVLN